MVGIKDSKKIDYRIFPIHCDNILENIGKNPILPKKTPKIDRNSMSYT